MTTTGYDTSALAHKAEGHGAGLRRRIRHRRQRRHPAHRDAAVVIITSGAIFAYAAAQLVGTAAGATENPAKVVRQAINSVVVRSAVFYVGSLILLALLLPHTAYGQGTSPLVRFFSSIGMPAAGDIMNVVVLTAALSSVNAGLYSTGRIPRSMCLNGRAPKFTAQMTKRGVPFTGTALRACVTVGVLLELVVPSEDSTSPSTRRHSASSRRWPSS
jgi:L-asparagine permease